MPKRQPSSRAIRAMRTVSLASACRALTACLFVALLAITTEAPATSPDDAELIAIVQSTPKKAAPAKSTKKPKAEEADDDTESTDTESSETSDESAEEEAAPKKPAKKKKPATEEAEESDSGKSADDEEAVPKKPAKKAVKKKPVAEEAEEGESEKPADDEEEKPAPKKAKKPAKKPVEEPAEEDEETEKKPTKPSTKTPVKPSTKPSAKTPIKPTKPTTGKGKGKEKAQEVLGPDPLLPEGVCHVCLGCNYVPLKSRTPLVVMETDKSPGASAYVPWQFCPNCQADRDPAELVEMEKTRLETSKQTHADWEKRLGVKLLRVETRHLTLHCEMAADMAHKQGDAAEAVIAYIQQKTRGVFMTPSRPNTFENLMNWDKPSYLRALEACKKVDEFQGDVDWNLNKDVASFSGRITTISNCFAGKQVPPEHLVISTTAARQINEASGGHIKDAVGIGFAYHCEFAVKNKVLVSYVRYQLNDTKFSDNWPNEAKRLYSERKMPAWTDLFERDLRDWTPPHHVAAFTLVSYLMRDPVRFSKVVLLTKTGMSPPDAIEKMYGKTIAQLEPLCGRWVMTGK